MLRVDRPARSPSRLVVLTVVLAVISLALGAWMIVDRAGSATLEASEIMAISDRSIVAWSEGDTAEIQATYVEDAVFTDGTRTLEGRDAIADYVTTLDGLGFVVEAASTSIVIDNTVATAVTYGAPGDMTVAVAVLEFNGDGLIVRHSVEDVTGVEVTL